MAAVVKAAPLMISRMVTDIRVADITPSRKLRQVSDRVLADSISAPTTPQEAHSVAVANPKTIARKTKATSASTGNRFAERRSRSPKGKIVSARGWLFLLNRDQIAM